MQAGVRLSTGSAFRASIGIMTQATIAYGLLVSVLVLMLVLNLWPDQHQRRIRRRQQAIEAARFHLGTWSTRESNGELEYMIYGDNIAYPRDRG